MNKVFLVGNTAKDPELKYTPGNNAPVATFSIAVSRTFKNKDGNYDADFFNIVVWNKLAEIVNNNLKKGRQVAVCGRLQTRSYEANDGSKRYVTEIIAEDVQFLGKKDGTTNNTSTSNNNTPDDDFHPTDEFDNDIPF
jgi:single-strand DNA-binding protein